MTTHPLLYLNFIKFKFQSHLFFISFSRRQTAVQTIVCVSDILRMLNYIFRRFKIMTTKNDEEKIQGLAKKIKKLEIQKK